MNTSQIPNSTTDSGLTLIELIVSMALGLIALALLGTMMIGVYGTQERVSGSSSLTNQAQVASDIFRATIRSAKGVELTEVSFAPSPNQLLVTYTLDKNSPVVPFEPAGVCNVFLWLSGEGGSPGKLYWASGITKSELVTRASIDGLTELVSRISPEPLLANDEPDAPSVAPGIFEEGPIDGLYSMKFLSEPILGPKTRISLEVAAPNVKDEETGGCF